MTNHELFKHYYTSIEKTISINVAPHQHFDDISQTTKLKMFKALPKLYETAKRCDRLFDLDGLVITQTRYEILKAKTKVYDKFPGYSEFKIKIEKAIKDLEKQGNTNPTDEQIVEQSHYMQPNGKIRTRFSKDKLIEVRNADGTFYMKNDFEDIFPDRNYISPLTGLIKAEEKEKLKAAIMKLPEIEKIAIALYDFEELNYKEIGLVIGTTGKNQASQPYEIRKRALKNMWRELSQTDVREPYSV